MIHLPAIVSLIAAGASGFLAVVVYWRAPDRKLGAVFAGLAAALVCWNLNFATLYAIHDYDLAFRLTWIFRTGAVFLLPAILHLCLILPGKPLGPYWRIILIGDYGLAAVLATANVFGLLVPRLESFSWGYHSVGSSFYNLFAALVVFNSPLALFVLVREYLTTSEPRMRLQLKFWLLGVAIALPLGVTNLLPSYGIPSYPLGNLGSAAWAALVGYAIARYRLMDIELVVTRSLAYLAAILMLVSPAFGIALLCQWLAFGEVHYDFSAVLAVLLLLVGIGFAVLRGAVEARLERALFPAKVLNRNKLRALGKEAVRILDREKLLDVLADSVSIGFDVERLALYLRQGSRPGFALLRAVGTAPVFTEIPSNSALARWLFRAGGAVIREEAAPFERAAGSRQISETLTLCGWEACVPFIGGNELLGFLGLGRKRGMQAYSTGDLDLLTRVAAEASIALQNARLYEELRKSREAVTRVNRLSAIGTLAAGVAHEIRNPLVSIQTFFQLAPHRLDDEEFMTSFLRLAENEVHRIGRLVSELLTFAKSPSAAMKEVDINEIVGRVVSLLAPQASAGRVSLKGRLTDRLPPVVGDSDQLMQVFLNLTLNALQATKENGEVIIETRSVKREAERYCEVSVSDSGEGIPEEIRESIFDPFFTTKEKGSGLGLAICHQIIQETGGFMSVESTKNKGSTFTVSLPAQEGTGSDAFGEGGAGTTLQERLE
ncbi:MAG: ATP-binding protein [Candidatus Binatia bacterium]